MAKGFLAWCSAVFVLSAFAAEVGKGVAGELVETSRRILCENAKPMNFCFAQRFPDGTIYMSHSIGRHTVDERHVLMSSADDGLTWKDGGPIGGMNSFLTKDGLKRQVACWSLVETNVHTVTVTTIGRDGKATRRTSQVKLPAAQQLLFHRGILRLRDGTLLATGYQNNSARKTCVSYVLSSADDGLTWSYLSTVPEIAGTQEGLNESTAVQLKDGSVQLYVRSGHKYGRPGADISLYRFVSRDGGKTWDAGRRFADAGVDPQAMLLSDGTLALLSGRPGLWLMLDKTGTGDHFVRHEVFSGMGSSYATLMETAPGKLLVVYDDSAFIQFKGDRPTNRIMAVTYDYRRGLAARESGRAEIAWTRTVCVEPNRYIGWPTVCRLKNGDLVAVFSGDRDQHVCPYGKVQLVRSTDGGETWSAPKTIANGLLDDRDAGVVQLPNGEIVVTWFTSIAYNSDWEASRHPEFRRHHEKLPPELVDANLGYYLIRSADNGETWTKPLKLVNCDQTPHGPILLKDGSLLQIGRRSVEDKFAAGKNLFGKTIISISRSTDGGRTWSYVCPEIPSSNGEGEVPHMFHEPHVAELPDGTLVGMVRYHGDDGNPRLRNHGYMRITFSKDGGKTWSPMAKSPLLGLPPHLLALPDGRLVCAYGRRVGEYGCGEFAAVSDDGGRTWDTANEITLEPSHNGDLGYPASTLLADGWILTVFYQQLNRGEKTRLMATKWRLR